MKALILYASKNGCAADAAKYLAEKLTPNADCVDLRDYKSGDLQGYDWFVIGGSVYAGKVMGDAIRFCEQNRDALLTKNVALFVSCTTPDKASEYMKSSFPTEIYNHALEKTNFGGEIRPDKLSFPMRKAVEMMRKRSGGTRKVGIAYDNIDKVADTINGV